MAQGFERSIRILLVEDEVEARQAIAQYLEGRGHAVRTAGGADEALAQAALAPPDVVLCDWRLGTDDGVDVVRRLQQSCDCVSVFMTADSLSALRSAATGLQVHGFLRKPATMEQIATAVERAAQR